MKLRSATFAALVVLLGAGQALAECPPGLPPGVFCAARDLGFATAGVYNGDPQHSAVIARVSHLGYSMSVFRFDQVDTRLVWNPAQPTASKLYATVRTASISTPVKGFAAKLAGPEFLNAAQFPTATFVSTTVRQIDPRRGEIDGQLTLLGKKRPVTLQVNLVGAGKGLVGKPRIGGTARAMINPKDFGMPPLIVDPIELVMDVEFEKTTK